MLREDGRRFRRGGTPPKDRNVNPLFPLVRSKSGAEGTDARRGCSLMAHATAHGHDPVPPPLPCRRPAPLLVFLAVLVVTSYLALTRLPAAAPLAALIAPRPGRDAEPGHRDSCAGFYGGAGASTRAVSASVEEFGAVGDGATSNTAAFRRAVAALEERARAAGGTGGARLEVPPGRWLTGSFNLTSRFTLFLHDGAVILGSQPLTLVPYDPWEQ